MKKKIVILDGYASNPGDLSWEELERLGDLTVYDRTPPELLAARIADAQVIFTNKVPLDAAAVQAAPRLELIGLLATGYNIVDLDAARARGIPVCNIVGYSTGAVAQMTLALLLELTQQVGQYNALVHRGDWTNCPDFCCLRAPLTELAGKTMGLIGYGAIGQAVGRLALALDMRLLVTARHEKAVPEGARYTTLDELLTQSDVISLHCPLTPQSTRLIDAAALQKMKPGALLLNTARGALVDEQAVADALRAGTLGGYGADVVTVEPIPAGHPLLTAPRCILTPHIAWAPKETRIRLHHLAAENLRAYLAGHPINVVNP